jgi:hypothetical protein
LLEGRSFYIGNYTVNNEVNNEYYKNIKVTLVNDDISIITSGTQFFSARAGNASEAWRYNWLRKKSPWRKAFNEKNAISTIWDSLFNKKKLEDPPKPNNIIRGSWGTYIGLEGFDQPMRIVNIYIPGYDI